MADFVITSTQGGLNNSDPPIAIADDQVTEAFDIEWVRSPLGARRRGATAISLAGSVIPVYEMVTFLQRHLPDETETSAQLWAMGVSGSSSALAYKDTTWHTVTPSEAITVTGTYKYQVQGQSLHGKNFLAYKSSVDRLHVWDGTSLRKSGLAEPAAPTGANDGGVGTFTGTRYYRVRYTVQSGGTTLRRSEPSNVLTFAPNGNDTGIVVTKPTTINESETHWELEASLDNANFYVLATTVVGTTTVTDTTDYLAGYAQTYDLSEDVGDYALIPSVRFLAADQDRLVYGGSFEDPDAASIVGWSPVANDPGSGNDERTPTDTDNFLNLDGLVGGGLTGLSNPVNGYIYAFKIGRIYKLIRTGSRAAAYEAVLLTDKRGAIEGSITEGIDQAGRPCLYFVDPTVGPCRLGNGGLLTCGADIERTWKTVNIDASLVARSLYYPANGQVHWWLAVDELTPDTHIVLHVRNTTDTPQGVRRGWAIWRGASRYVLACCLFAQNVDDGVSRSKVLQPFVSIGIGT